METDSSFPPVKIRGKYLHSPYNPLREAEKIIGEADYTGKTHVILFEPGRCYAGEILLKKYPSLRLLVLSPLDLLPDGMKGNERVACWTGDLEGGMEGFLSEHIHESDLDRLAYLPWPPSVRILSEEASLAGGTLSRFLNRLGANRSHILGFGRKNLRNSIINFLQSAPPRLPDLRGKPVIIAASGPGLGNQLEEIKRHGRGHFLLALPSAVPALEREGITPDLILSTDPGYWASCHFSHFPPAVPVGIGLNGRAEYSGGRVISLLFNQQTYPDRLFLSGIPLPPIGGTGSVALAALEWVSPMGASSVTFAGLDMCLSDLRSHVSPHGFESLLMARSERRNSLYQIYFERAQAVTAKREGSLRYGRSLDQYRSWLEGRSFPVPLYRLGPNGLTLRGLEEINRISPLPESSCPWHPLPYPDRKTRKRRILSLIENWRVEIPRRLEGYILSPFPGQPDEFDDFIYTLIPDKFTRLREWDHAEKAHKVTLKESGDSIGEFLNRMEELCERIS